MTIKLDTPLISLLQYPDWKIIVEHDDKITHVIIWDIRLSVAVLVAAKQTLADSAAEECASD